MKINNYIKIQVIKLEKLVNKTIYNIKSINNMKNNEKKILKDEEILNKMIKDTETNYYTFGAYTDYNNLDVKNLKNPIFDKK